MIQEKSKDSIKSSKKNSRFNSADPWQEARILIMTDPVPLHSVHCRNSKRAYIIQMNEDDENEGKRVGKTNGKMW